MMDGKYLAEIKARCELGRPAQQREVKALLAEVERLNAYESIDLLPEQIEAMQGHNIALIEENAAKDQQIDTLKKALELICEDCSDACPAEWGAEHALCETCNSDDPKQRAKCQYDYYIQQAQEQEGHDGD